jgi:hypothetical protein
MSYIDMSAAKLEQVRRALREAPLMAVRELLKDEDVLDACRECKHEFRDRRYGPVVTVLHFVAQAIQRESSFAATWQELWTPLAASFPELAVERFVPSGLSHARARLPQPVLESLASQACARTREIEPERWHGFRLWALDCSTVSMPRNAELFAHFGIHRAGKTTMRYPLGTLATLLSVGDSLIGDYRFGPFDRGEDSTARPLLRNLGEGDLLLADRRLSGTPSLARIRATRAHFLLRKHQRLIVKRLPVIRRLGRNDFITEIPMNAAARKADPALPETVRVRIFEGYWKTPAGEKVKEWFVTSLEDPKLYKKAALAKLYHERWQIETSYLEFKQLFHADVLRSKTVANIHKEFAAHVLAYQLVRLLIQSAARKHHKKPTEISFLHAARWVISFSHRMAAVSVWSLPFAYQRLLDAIASCEIDVRPGRLEPRAITREKKHYPYLRISRAEWRQQRLGRTG